MQPSVSPLLLLLSLVAAGCYAFGDLDGCRLAGNPPIDLNPLKDSNGGLDWKVASITYPGFSFLIKICAPLFYTSSLCPINSSVCEYFGTGATHQYVVTSSWAVSRITNGAQLSGIGGPCQIGNYKATIDFICDTAASPLINTLDDYQNCIAKFQMKTPVACGGGGSSPSGSSSKTDVGMIICLLFFIPFIVYFIVGAGYMYHQGKRGPDMVPNREFWVAIPGLIKDGAIYSWGVVSGKERLGYSKV